jgi:hypothetical protein
MCTECSVQNVNILYKNTPVVFPHVYVLALMNHQIYLKFKGQCHEIFDFPSFFSPSNPRPTILNFLIQISFKNCGDIWILSLTPFCTMPWEVKKST